MVKRSSDSKPDGDERDSYKLELVGLAAESDWPRVVLQALDSDNVALHTQDVGSDGGFSIPADVLKRAQRVVLGAADDKGGIQPDASVSYRASEFSGQIKGRTLALAEGIWSRFLRHWVCTSGSVQVCWRRPWWYDAIITTAITPVRTRALTSNLLAALPSSRVTPSLNDLIYWPYRCAPVCLGTVEVYRRTCCCWPIVIEDTRITDLIRDLEIYVEQLPKPPKLKIPPPPSPPLGDPLLTPFFKGGGLNELAINATNDLHMLSSLPADQAAQYIQSRAYLLHRLCSCSRPSKVGSGTIQSDGTFSICWLEPWRLLLPNCYEQYAYVVRQTIGGSTTTIYDGLVAGAWFAAGDQPVLTSYNGNAFSCNETGSGSDDAYVLLNLIGDTESHELITPTSTGWDRVAAPGPTSGLLFPNIGPNNSHLRNLGGRFELTFTFSLGMRSIGARYYRVSICKADASGNPTGPRYYYGDGLVWQKYLGPANIELVTLGPTTQGGESHLYDIPYSDEPWIGAVRYHALINTLSNTADMNLNAPGAVDLDSPADNHLITLEVFDVSGKRLRPLGTPASGQPGAETTAAFKFRRWFQPGGSPGDDTAEVPFAALTHLFCWDNRLPVADITRLVMNGVASDEECQFMSGSGNSTFAIEYRAYVPDQRFQYSHGIGWLRGLNASAANGGVGTLQTPLSPANVGKPPTLPVISGSNTFEHMLTRLDPPNPPTVLNRCSFAVTLTTYAKTTNGEDLSYPYGQETAAFALSIHGHGPQ